MNFMGVFGWESRARTLAPVLITHLRLAEFLDGALRLLPAGLESAAPGAAQHRLHRRLAPVALRGPRLVEERAELLEAHVELHVAEEPAGERKGALRHDARRV